MKTKHTTQTTNRPGNTERNGEIRHEGGERRVKKHRSDRRDRWIPGGGRDTRRGQSTLVGAILLFGILILLLAIIQLSAVPNWNNSIEVDHNERVQEDLREVMSAVHDVGEIGESRTRTVELGVDYPTRPFLLNPPPASGRLAATEPSSFEIGTVEILGVDNYWTGNGPSGVIEGSTYQLVYEPDYNEHDPAPRTVYENGLLYNEIRGQAILATEPFIDGNRISLTALAGTPDRRGTGTVSVPIRPESGSSQAVPVRSSTGAPVEVTVPTRLPESEWEAQLEPEFVSNGGNILGNEGGVTVQDGNLTVTLTPETVYELELARVALDERTDRMGPRYITAVSGGEGPIATDGPERLVFEVRNEFNNPVRGEQVSLEATNGNLSLTDARTGPDGRVSVRYTPPSESGTQTVTAAVDIDEDPAVAANERANITLRSTGAGGEGSDDRFVNANPPAGSDRIRVAESSRVRSGVDITFLNGRNATHTLAEFRVAMYHAAQTPTTPDSGTYSYGSFQTTFDIPGTFVAVDGPTLQPGEEDTISVGELVRGNPTGDLMLIHAIWVDDSGEEHGESYFISITR